MTRWTILAAAAFLVQSAPPFEVASVKPGTGCDSRAGRSGGARAADDPERLDIKCETVTGLIRIAYGTDLEISGGPEWIHTERYDIAAKPESPQSSQTLRGPMLRALLADRFHLQARRETREIPTYELVVGKGKPQLKPAQPGRCTPRGEPRQAGKFPCGAIFPSADGAWMYGTTLHDFCGAMSTLLKRPVIDKTGIEGIYDFFFEPPPDGAGSIESAVMNAINDVGLKLVDAKGSKEFLAIDHVERPSAN